MRTSFRIVGVNEAVRKHLNKSRSLALRHVSRTHRVDLDWLYDQIQ